MSSKNLHSPLPSLDGDIPLTTNRQYRDDPNAENEDDYEPSPLELQGGTMSSTQPKKSRWGITLFALACLLAAAAFGGKQYYFHHRQEGSAGDSKGIRGKGGEGLPAVQDSLEVGIEDKDAADAAVGRGKESSSDSNTSADGGLDEFEGVIEGGGDDSLSENFQSEDEDREEDVDFDGIGDDIDEGNGNIEDESLASDEEEKIIGSTLQENVEEVESTTVNEETLDEKSLSENENSEDLGDSQQEDGTDPTNDYGELPGNEASIDEKKSDMSSELPDYFVPLTPTEREELKDRLRSTLLLTKSSLLSHIQGDFDSENYSPQRTLLLDPNSPKQFMHMHHMKTGGTSVDSLIGCALRRQGELHNGDRINYNSVSECGPRVKMCMDDLARKLDSTVVDNVFYRNDAEGNPNLEDQFDPADSSLDIPIDSLNVCETSEANVMSYCASLHAVRTFGWKDVDKITVIRNPIDRAWSMYRFTLTSCYKCQPMDNVLEKIANGTFASERSRHSGDDHENGSDVNGVNYVYSPNDSCAVQMIGHQATNLLSSIDLYNVANDVRFPREKEIAEEAVKNLRNEFTWIGLTDRLQESIDAFREVFPFLAENLTETALKIEERFLPDGEIVADGNSFSPDSYANTKVCEFGHKNGGRDPTCGTKELDDYTISLINRLSNRDVAVYKAAVERFEIQMEVLEEYKSSF